MHFFLNLARSPVTIAELSSSAARLGVPGSAPACHEDSRGKERLTCPKIGGKKRRRPIVSFGDFARRWSRSRCFAGSLEVARVGSVSCHARWSFPHPKDL